MLPRPVSRRRPVRLGLALSVALASLPWLGLGPAAPGVFGQEKPPRVPDEAIGGLANVFRRDMDWEGRLSAASREKLVKAGGGSVESQAAVALGLKWLALHQCADGHWSLHEFHRCACEKVGDDKRFSCNCGGPGMKNDTAATAFGLLPFLGGGITHKSDAQWKDDYRKTVAAGLKWLQDKQADDGDLGGGMYAHALATTALCEAYALSSDPALKKPAQKALDYIIAAQDPASGGWRYTPRSGGDTSVTGWQVTALKAGLGAGLSVPRKAIDGAEKWLDSCMTKDGGYGYTQPEATPTMTAVGLLCREHLGWSWRNASLLSGVARLGKYPPGEIKSVYYHYYATQVLYHLGGDRWAGWNPKMRDLLVKTQGQGKDEKSAHQAGSWDPREDAHGAQGGRIMQTSLSLLTLEVYYRYASVYRPKAAEKDKD
jgi:hypothetical protein